MAITALKGLGKAFVEGAKKLQRKADKFGKNEIRKMNSSKVSDQISAWSKPGIPATINAIYKTKKEKKEKKNKE
jgi:hypothetical protein